MDEQESQWEYTGAQTDSGQTQGLTPEIEAISWSASEYIAHEKNSAWYALLLIVSIIVTALVYLIYRDILTAIAILTVAFSFGFFAGRKPGTKNYELSARGLSVDGNTLDLSQFKSFSVVDEGAINSIWLKKLGRFTPHVIIYYSPEDEQKITNSLSAFLPHEERELDAIDRATKRLRF